MRHGHLGTRAVVNQVAIGRAGALGPTATSDRRTKLRLGSVVWQRDTNARYIIGRYIYRITDLTDGIIEQVFDGGTIPHVDNDGLVFQAQSQFLRRTGRVWRGMV